MTHPTPAQVRAARAGRTQAEFATLLDVSRSIVGKWERGERRMSRCLYEHLLLVQYAEGRLPLSALADIRPSLLRLVALAQSAQQDR